MKPTPWSSGPAGPRHLANRHHRDVGFSGLSS
jgi:hypothetical protein